MAFGSIFSSLGGAAMDLFGPKAGKAELGQSIALAGSAEASRYSARANTMRAGIYRDNAAGYGVAADLSAESLGYQERSTAIQLAQADREITKVIGGQGADVAGAGFSASGSALDILRDSARQGEITKEIIGTQGEIEENVYRQAIAGYKMQQSAELGNADIAALSAEADTAQAGVYSQLSGFMKQMSEDAKTRQKVSGVLKGIAGIAELGMFIGTGGLGSLLPRGGKTMGGGTAP